MLRSLSVWESDKAGNIVIGEDDRPVALKGRRAGQPKSREQMSADELHYLDVIAKEREDDIAIMRYRAKIEREAVLRAARADAPEN